MCTRSLLGAGCVSAARDCVNAAGGSWGGSGGPAAGGVGPAAGGGGAGVVSDGPGAAGAGGPGAGGRGDAATPGIGLGGGPPAAGWKTTNGGTRAGRSGGGTAGCAAEPSAAASWGSTGGPRGGNQMSATPSSSPLVEVPGALRSGPPGGAPRDGWGTGRGGGSPTRRAAVSRPSLVLRLSRCPTSPPVPTLPVSLGRRPSLPHDDRIAHVRLPQTG